MAVTFAGGYVPVTHLAPIDTYEADFVAVAERFLGVPYLWGGKTALGLDCSGLVQVALSACGVVCPRDSDMQERALGAPVAVTEDGADLRRGDLVFWKGHVAIVRDDAKPSARQCLPHGRRRSSQSSKPSLASAPRGAKSPACGGWCGS